MRASHELILKDLRRVKKIDQHSLDLVFSAFYFAGRFNNEIPVDFGREALKIITEKEKDKTL